MTNTINNVPRELLERVKSLCEYWFVRGQQQHMSESEHKTWHALGFGSSAFTELRALLSAPSPDGVDWLEVFGYVSQDDIKWKGDCTLRLKPYSDYTIPLCRLSDAQAISDGLRGEVGAQRVKTCIALKERNDAREERDAALAECERLRMQLAACGVVALANTIESAGEARQMRPDYMSASCSDVADAVDREIALRAERDDLLQQLAVRDEEIERIRVQLMTIASAEPARHSIEWAKAVAATGNNEVYAKWREAFDERDQQAQRIGELERLLRDCYPGCGLTARQTQSIRERIDAALSAGKDSD